MKKQLTIQERWDMDDMPKITPPKSDMDKMQDKIKELKKKLGKN